LRHLRRNSLRRPQQLRQTKSAPALAQRRPKAPSILGGTLPDALDLFSRAESIIHAPPHLLYIARAHDKLGKLVTLERCT
jgi:hypothetical protein